MMSALIALAVVALLVAASALPLLGVETEAQAPSNASDLQARKDDVVSALREVDMDFAMGKITAEDRDRLRGELEGRAMRILAAIDRASSPPGKDA